MKNLGVLESARHLHALGLAIIWIRPKSKIPVESGWTTGARKGWDYLRRTYKDGYNVGVRLGTPSVLNGRYLAVVDVDIKSGDDRHLREAMGAVKGIINPKDFPMVRTGRGMGSRHYYCSSARPFKTYTPARSKETVRAFIPSKTPSKRDKAELSEKDVKTGWRISAAWEVSLYSDGRQVVLPPSSHPDTGQKYEWVREITNKLPLFVPVSNAGTELNEGPNEKKPVTPLEDFEVSPVEFDWLPISDSLRAAIKNGEGVSDRSAYLMKAFPGLLSAGLSRNEALTVLTDPNLYLGECAYDHAKTSSRKRAAEWLNRFTLKKVESEKTTADEIFGKIPLPPPCEAAPDWREDLDVRYEKKEKKVTTSLKNLDLIFTNGIDGIVFIEDLFASRIEYGANTPWGGKAGVYIQDIDMIRIKRWLADTEFRIEPHTNAILEATSLVADRHRVHPVKDWLNTLKWDGIKRVDTWIKDYCRGRAVEPYLSEISRKFLLAMVKRIFEPGCQWDYVLVLEGKQGKYKSSIARALASDRWFMDNLPDLKDKDSMLNLQGKWLIELGELADVKRADYNLVKAYLVRRTDTVRPHYGRLKNDVPRQSVFIGTINEGQYLRDPTGNRRYWPVKVGRCDVAALKKVRDQLFAEAMHIYRSTDEILMLGKLAAVQAEEAQEDRKVDDDGSEMKEALLVFQAEQKKAEAPFDFSCFRLRDLMKGPWAMWSGKGWLMNTAAHVLLSLGFEKHRSNGQRFWRKIPE